MQIQIVGRKESGTCSMSGKKNVEVWGLRINGGDIQLIATNRLLECLRMLTSVGPTPGAKPSNKEEEK